MRILLTSIGSYGDLNPYIGLGRALLARGHRPVLVVTEGYSDAVEAAGLECRPIRSDGDPQDPELIRRVMDPLRGPEYLIRKLLMPRLREAYDNLLEATRDADAIVSHPLTFAAPLVAEKRGLPWAGAVLAPINFFSRMDPPLVVPSPIVAAGHRRWPVALGSALVALGKIGTRTWGRPVERFRREVGLPPGGHPLYEGQFSPHLNLAMFSSVLATPQPDWPPHTIVTGAISYDAIHGGMPADLARFLDAGSAPIVFTLGSAVVSVSGARRIYETGAAVARTLARRAVLLVGRSPENRPAATSPDVFVAEWAPHSELFPRAAAIVHQGGAGTLHTALASGRPMVIVPFAHDQPDNAARTERLGIARVIYPRQFKTARVGAALESLLADRDVSARAAAVAERVRRENGGATAAAAIEGLSELRRTPAL